MKINHTGTLRKCVTPVVLRERDQGILPWGTEGGASSDWRLAHVLRSAGRGYA